MKLYEIKAEYLYGEEREAKRAAQLALLERLGAKESGDGRVLCDADTALALMHGGYCDRYATMDASAPVYEVKPEVDVESLVSAAITKSVEAVGQLFNEKCSQEQPGPALMDIAETLLLEDSCTDALQEHFAAGWRLLAICPQPQRRPDYILGRGRSHALRGYLYLTGEPAGERVNTTSCFCFSPAEMPFFARYAPGKPGTGSRSSSDFTSPRPSAGMMVREWHLQLCTM